MIKFVLLVLVRVIDMATISNCEYLVTAQSLKENSSENSIKKFDEPFRRCKILKN